MAISKIEQLIEDIYEFIESCKMQPFSSTKVVVPKDELYDLLDELRLRTPDEIKRYQKIISQRDAILADAEEKANAIMGDADNRALSMINEHEIMQQAYNQANDLMNDANLEAEKILTEANYQANQIKANSLVYTEQLLNNIESITYKTYIQANQDYEELSKNLKENLDLIKDNKQELAVSTGKESEDETTNLEEFDNEEHESNEEVSGDYDDIHDNFDDNYDDFNDDDQDDDEYDL